MKFIFDDLDLSASKTCFEKHGFVGLDSFFSENEISELKTAVSVVKKLDDVELYFDRSNLVRRIENFTFKNEVFININKRIQDLLFKLTKKKQNLFKDKINFKPPNGEGFYAHYDGIFQFKTIDGLFKNGWYEYASDFNSVLICLDDFTIENGAIEVANIHVGNFEKLLKNTKGNGSPDIKDNLVEQLEFFPILAKAGSVVVFKHNCPHRSSPNYTSSDRCSLYLTYNNSKDGDFYYQYFKDKKSSVNANKALLGDQINS